MHSAGRIREQCGDSRQILAMDINLRLLSGEHVKEDEEPDVIDHMLSGDDKLQSGDGSHGIMMDIGDDLNVGDGENISSPTTDMLDYKTDVNLEPLSGMEFASHGEAYSFYQEYARSMGFNTAIQNSRRSKTSREFIDAKFACSRYGTKREYEKPYNRQRSRQECKQDIENSTGRRSFSKTDCKACMHVKRRSDGKWTIHRFEKEHNHELLPAQAVSEQTRKMYAAMARQFAEYKSVAGLKSDSKTPFDKGRNLVLEVGEAKMLLDFCTHMQSANSNFFYAADISDDQRLKSLFWVDAKSRHDYASFSDVVSFDTTYVRNKYKMPLILFIGVNQHYQFMLLGCALVADDNASTLSWVLQTWLKAMGGHGPKVIISDQDRTLKSIIEEALPSSYHCYCLWHIFGKVSDTLSHLIKQHGSFLLEFEECVYRSWTKEEFEKRWQNWVERYDLKENEWIQSLYEDRAQWAPTYLKDTFLGGMSTAQRSESVNCFFDKYLHKKTSIQEFLKQYDVILQERYEEEAKADSDSWNRTLTVKSPSPFEKHLSGKYTNAVLRKFQTEVLGAVACIPKREGADEETSIEPVIFRVQDYEKDQEFTVSWSASKSEVSCVCRLYEFRGFLCRHALIVLQICGLSVIPSQYILRRWTKDAKQRPFTGEASEHVQSRMQRYNNLFQRAMALVEEGSMSHESYNFALRALEDAFGNCLGVNSSNKNLTESATSPTAGLLCIEEGNQSRSMSANNKKKNPTKKRKVNSEQDVMTIGPQESFQHMDKLSSRTPPFDSYFPQQNIPGMVQLNLMAAPTRDSYYGNHQTIQGLGQLSSMAPNHDGYYSSQPSMHGMGQMDFFRAQTSFAYGVREESSVRSSQLHDEASRHA